MRKAMSSPGKKETKFWELVTKSYQGTRHQYRSDPLSDPSPLDLFRWPYCWVEDFRTPLFSYLQLKAQRHQELSRLVWPCWCLLAASRRYWQASFWFWETLLFCNFWRKVYGSWNCFTVFVFRKKRQCSEDTERSAKGLKQIVLGAIICRWLISLF